MVDLPNESDKATRQIESSNIYDEVASFNSIANAQTDMICRYEEVVNDDSMDDSQIDMIYHPDDEAILFILLLVIKMTLSFYYFFCSLKIYPSRLQIFLGFYQFSKRAVPYRLV